MHCSQKMPCTTSNASQPRISWVCNALSWQLCHSLNQSRPLSIAVLFSEILEIEMIQFLSLSHTPCSRPRVPRVGCVKEFGSQAMMPSQKLTSVRGLREKISKLSSRFIAVTIRTEPPWTTCESPMLMTSVGPSTDNYNCSRLAARLKEPAEAAQGFFDTLALGGVCHSWGPDLRSF